MSIKSGPIGWALDERDLSMEGRYRDLCNEIARAVGSHAQNGDAQGVKWFRQVCDLIFTEAEKILAGGSQRG